MQIDRVITSAVILLVILLAGFFLLLPEFKEFKSLQLELGRKKAEFNAQYDYYAVIDKVHSDLQAHKEDLQKVDDALPEESSLGRLVYFFQKTAKDNGMMLKDMFLSKPSLSSIKSAQGSKVKDITFSMDLIGDYKSLEKYIIALEQSARIFEVTSISFGTSSAVVQNPLTGGKTPIQQTYAFNLQVKTHSY